MRRNSTTAKPCTRIYLTKHGGIVDDLLVYRLNDEEYMLVVNASNIDKDWDWITHYNTQEAELENASDRLSLLAVQGPHATEVLQKLTSIDLAAMKFYTFVNGTMAGIDNVIISATGYTGAGGFELYVDNAYAKPLWDAIFEVGGPFMLFNPWDWVPATRCVWKWATACTATTLMHGTSPFEAGLGWVTKFSKAFTNDISLKEQKAAGGSKN